MGTEDMRRQRPNVLRMELLGRAMAPVDAGTATLKEAISAAIRDWTHERRRRTHYVLGSCAGPAPYPALVRDLQRVIGDEARAQMLDAGRPAAGPRDRVRRRRLERDRDLHRVRAGRRRRARRRRGRGRGDRDRPPRRAADDRRPRRRAARRVLRDHAGRGRPDPRGALDLAPGSTTPASAPSTRGCATAAAPATRRSPTPTRSPPSGASRSSRGSSRRSSPRTRSRGCSASDARAPDTIDLVCLSGRGDKDLAEALDKLGMAMSDRIAAAFNAAAGRAALMPYLMGGFPDVETSVASRRRLRRRRRGPGRARRAVLGPARRRPGDPRGGHRRRWPRGATVHAVLAGRRADRRARPGRAHVLREPDLRARPRALRRRARRRAASAA